MSNRLFAANCPVIHCAPKRRTARWPRAVAFVLGSILLGWLLSSCEQHEPVSPWLSGSLMGLLFFFTVVMTVLAVRKTAAASGGMTNEEGRMRKDADVFEPLRAPGEAIPAEDVERILVACAAEGRCIMKHVRRAQTTLSVEDYGDELRLAERKLDAVVRCVEALVERLSDPQTRRQSEPETVRLGDIEQCEREGGVL